MVSKPEGVLRRVDRRGYVCMGLLPSAFKTWGLGGGIVMPLGRNVVICTLFYSCNWSAVSLELGRDDSFSCL